MNLRLPRWAAAAVLLLAALTLLAVTQDAHARRLGGGMSFGRQSTNVLKQRQAVKPPAAQATPRAATPAAGAAAGTAAAGTAAKSGMSRWLGPIAGIAAGLGIAALLSSLGLSGAFLEFLSSALLIGLVVFAVMFLVRRLRGTQQPLARAAAGGAASGNHYRQSAPQNGGFDLSGSRPAPAPAASAAPVIEAVSSVQTQDPSWFIPEGFDVPAFLDQAKRQFTHVQSLWDAGDRDGLREFLTDDLLAEITPRLPSPDEGNRTDVVLLNAELLGIETVAGGHLASVRYSGMLRESVGSEAFHFEEVWNLYKADGAGWLLAGIQQTNAR
ncbi:MAG: TIM44-like domain-containing protein [Castellaniella sp.]|uniref:Tim44 domain-containing protein n=1 Tax=Castellaniella sp. TaxID=1955812 RepID=UPI002A362C78|nr:TIM44-like domain-containing protein [Castellaniella sp.]MDY0308638.1 TIM44-like domain-containing protein [Castellaniella sp.]